MTAGNGTHMKVTSDPLLSSESMQAVAMSGRFVGFILETSTPPSPPWSDKGSKQPMVSVFESPLYTHMIIRVTNVFLNTLNINQSQHRKAMS